MTSLRIEQHVRRLLSCDVQVYDRGNLLLVVTWCGEETPVLSLSSVPLTQYSRDLDEEQLEELLETCLVHQHWVEEVDEGENNEEEIENVGGGTLYYQVYRERGGVLDKTFGWIPLE